MSERELLAELRSYISKAVDEIEKLRKSNQELNAQIASLKESGSESVGTSDLQITPDQDSEDLREKIQQFINSIDSYLESTAD